MTTIPHVHWTTLLKHLRKNIHLWLTEVKPRFTSEAQIHEWNQFIIFSASEAKSLFSIHFHTHDFLLECKHVIIEEHVQFLVSVVDAQLFQGVRGEVLKAEDIQHPERAPRLSPGRWAAVDVADQPREGAGVQSSRHGVAVFSGLEWKMVV